MRRTSSGPCSMTSSVRSLPCGAGVRSLAAAGHAWPSRPERSMLRAAARRSEPSSALVNKLQFHCKAPLSLVLRPMQPSQRLATPIRRPRNSVSWPARPAAPARAAVTCTCQRASAKMCSGRACAVSWNCMLECAPRARTRVCSRARVRVCCAGAAQVLPNEPTLAGNGPPVLGLPNYRTLPRAHCAGPTAHRPPPWGMACTCSRTFSSMPRSTRRSRKREARRGA